MIRFTILTDGAISELVMGAAPKSFDIKHNAKYYIECVVELLKKSKKKPYFNLLATCPHTTLFDKIDDLVGKNQIKRFRWTRNKIQTNDRSI